MSGITVIGSLNMDISIKAPRLPVPGESVIGSDFMTSPGGKGANQAVAAARLGCPVRMIGCVGNDSYGLELIEHLKRNNVDTRYVKFDEKDYTGIALITLKDGENYIITDPGANLSITPKLIESFENDIKDSSLLVLQLEIPLDAIEAAINLARKHKVRILLNPAPIKPVPDSLLSMIDILILNETECKYFTGISTENIESVVNSTKALKSRGISQVIVTIGGKGVVYNKGEEIIHKPAHKVDVVDTTGAGDAFTAGIAVSQVWGWNIDMATDYANAAAGVTVTRRGAMISLPIRDEVLVLMNNA